ncbi:MAG: galactose-1-phosphate uridylyltransferase [Ruminococcaceae bacterium]|nr:galactose-1-phosphate uridylyltransferase [Oscillospiraceae bacterium]
MAELRYNPLTRDWVMIASHRQARPNMPKDWCPFCPGSGKVPDDFEVLKYDNDFPALRLDPPAPDAVDGGVYKTQDAYGKCEVILYSKNHTETLPSLSDAHMNKLVNLWCQRFTALRQDEKIKYIFIFENRGEVVGVSMPHPHGQIYGYPFLPKKLELEKESFRLHRQNTGNCLLCDMLEEEKRFEKRIIFENEAFTVFLPFFSEYPYGIYIAPKSCIRYITDLTENERFLLGQTIKQTVGMLDSLFDFAFPYMMCMHNAPINLDDQEDFHFHIQFFPPMRAADKQKFNASSETGAWAHCNPTAPEERAEELREAYAKFMKKET